MLDCHARGPGFKLPQRQNLLKHLTQLSIIVKGNQVCSTLVDRRQQLYILFHAQHGLATIYAVLSLEKKILTSNLEFSIYQINYLIQLIKDYLMNMELNMDNMTFGNLKGATRVPQVWKIT